MGFLRRILGGTPREAEAPAEDERSRIDLRGDLPPGYELIVQGAPLKIVGESFYREAIEAAVGVRPQGHWTIVDAVIALQPDNPYDPNAIAVLIGGRVCGHLSRSDAVAWQPIMQEYGARGVTPVARADVTGGWRQEGGIGAADFGITLYVTTPEQLAVRGEYVRTTCPHCGATFDPLPQAKKRCPACCQFVFVRTGPDGRRHILRDTDLADHDASWNAHREADEQAAQREAAAGAASMIAGALREYAILGAMAEFVAAPDACRTCAEFTGKVFDPRSAPPIPVPGCLGDYCRCDYSPRV